MITHFVNFRRARMLGADKDYDAEAPLSKSCGTRDVPIGSQRRTCFHGLARVGIAFTFALTAHNLVRLPKLVV